MRFAIWTAIVVALYLVIANVFAIRQITVVGKNIQLLVDQKKFPLSLLFFPSQTIREELLAANPILGDIRFEKKYPSTLIIVPSLRQAVAVVATPSRRVLIDENRRVLADADTPKPQLVVISIPLASVRVGQEIQDTRLEKGLALITGLHTFLPVETMTITDDGVLQARSGKLDILCTQLSDISSVISTLQTLISGFRIKGTLPKVIDVRFDKPVITF